LRPTGDFTLRPTLASRSKLESSDRLRLVLKVSAGLEIGSWADSQFTVRNIFDLIGGGPYGTGMLGALITDIFVNGAPLTDT